MGKMFLKVTNLKVTDKNLRKWIWQERDRHCIFCGSAGSEDPHHILKVGIHGRIDREWNMFGTCRNCHIMIENGEISKVKEIEAVNIRLEQLGYTERFRTDNRRIRLEDTRED